MTAPAFALTTRQSLTVSPRLQQAVRLLQMSAIEFQQEVQQQLADNPFLEEGDSGDAGNEANGENDIASEISTAITHDDGRSTLAEARPELTPFDRAVAGSSSDTGSDRTPLALDADDSRAERETDTGDDRDSHGDGADEPDSAHERALTAADGDGAPRHDGLAPDPFNGLHAETSLRDHLYEQLAGARLSPRAQRAAMVVIETLDDDGYLREALLPDAVPNDGEPPLTEAELDIGLAIVQQFDPVGVAARSLVECLGLQLAACPASTPGLRLAQALVREHLPLLARHDYGGLQRRLDCSAAALHVAHGLIRHLNPRPAGHFRDARTDYVVADVLVSHGADGLSTAINPAVLSKARLNQGCIELLRRSNDARHPGMRHQLQEARWLLRNAEQRHVTIKRVAEVIVVRQRAFFEYGEVALKPLALREVADELGLHESTLSRATSNKYMATPRGLYEFRHFFSRTLATETGGTCSATAVRALIREMIESERPDDPLSDVTVARRLGESGICVARRTVAKYRNQLKLPPWELRHLP
ncbi:RNA polymerase factor sigma-54 [Nevskia sp.]|uniref:RNA polymerase factor sigma-54 n=1 Tax=Nevskia sp. TaxID=1929292 RepID=UPI0025D45546|nr:RNA polymerase factor sigma-54 [Nevskia sp.]